MSETVNRESAPESIQATGELENPAAMEQRIFRWMCLTVLTAAVVCAIFAPWRIATGVLLGGVLSLFNHQWLRTSVAAIFSAAAAKGARPKLRVARYVLRYFVVAVIVGVAYWLDIVSLTATLAGMCSFALAALLEGFMQIYFAIVHREES